MAIQRSPHLYLATRIAMKICLDIRVSTKGGTSTFVENYVRELDQIQHNHDIHFVLQPGMAAVNGRTQRTAVPYRNRLLEFQWSQIQLGRILSKHGIEIYHSLKHVGPIRCGSKTVYRVPAVGQFLGNYPLQKMDHIYWKYIAGLAYRKADLLIAVSQYVAKALVEHLGIPAERVITIHNGVDPRFRKLSPSEIPRRFFSSLGICGDYLLCVGNLVPVKNFATAIRAYAILHADRGELPQLVLAGGHRHPHYSELVEIVSRHRLEDRVIFAGYQSGDDLLGLYNGAKLLIHPSLHEGFSFTILEAMACGLPIVAAANTSIPETAGDAACYHQDPLSADELAAQLRKLLDDSKLCSELSKRGLLRAPKFTWKQCVTKTVEAYNKIA